MPVKTPKGRYSKGGDIRPKGVNHTTKGGTKCTGVDNDTRSILDMGIGIKPEGGLGGGSGKTLDSIESGLSKLNKKKGK
jgi:hypothetical protein